VAQVAPSVQSGRESEAVQEILWGLGFLPFALGEGDFDGIRAAGDR
jgi:hypothetical protein